jgi:hypothetical protein
MLRWTACSLLLLPFIAARFIALMCSSAVEIRVLCAGYAEDFGGGSEEIMRDLSSRQYGV